ncbi:uncharacterized protein LOC113239403 [Hyposmocoma kahamanoa]|uniref:uncharacterized protein LOC113239403 n=1 Tax=Hyposmocoma kahamanoa TaxID=1477025 RepID=UPI000E6D6F86|nr:uncharacterized protein LOC113239403 [Hyposmocoma kahamanoa]
MYDITVFVIVTVCAGTVVAAGSRPLTCFWCGPLANQVHKSTKPPPCEAAANHHMICEQQYTHCATVYTSPPHIESRLCTKIYSEECYTEFCNITRTWKISCPCEGNMCNVRDLQRERVIFDILNNLVDKTFKNYRFKRSNIEKAKSMKKHLGQIIADEENETLRATYIPFDIPKHDLASPPVPSFMTSTTESLSPNTATNNTCRAKSAHKLQQQKESEEKVDVSIKLWKKVDVNENVFHKLNNNTAQVLEIFMRSLEQHTNNALRVYTSISHVLLCAFISVYNLSII